ncbi:MAG TPA: transglycosylase SLT domain-containing protein [Gemmatimonadaceae bacterium]|nr:transglycosylase SLT domain-containing protein [Gemmatimonadaceae bacterium]
MPSPRAHRIAPTVRTLAAAVFALLGTVACHAAGADGDDGGDGDGPAFVRDLPGILARDTLVLLTPFNSTSYFIYRGEAMGFEYDLLRAFAEREGVVLRVAVVTDRDSLLQLLEEGVGDVAAGRLVPDTVEHRHVVFTRQLYQTAPALVQRDGSPGSTAVPGPVDTLVGDSALRHGALDVAEPRPSYAGERADLSARLITRPWELAGDTVHLPRHSPYLQTLTELEDRITGDIEVVEVGADTSIEALIRGVASAEIELTVAPENLARLRQSYFTNIAIIPRLGPPDSVVLAVRSTSPQLRAALDAWLADSATDRLRRQLYERYFIDRRGYRERAASDYLSSETGRLSRYDTLFKRYAPVLGWDWRLLASQAYQESRFVPTARSWAGAVGLLQLMPATARSVGVRDSRNPEQNVRGAVRYLQDLERFWKPHIPEPEMRLRFVLASYNVGIGHVRDAQRLAEKYGGDQNAWDDVAYWLLQKSKASVYTDPVVKYGFARGLEPVTYVALVLERFEHYRQFVEAGTASEE